MAPGGRPLTAPGALPSTQAQASKPCENAHSDAASNKRCGQVVASLRHNEWKHDF